MKISVSRDSFLDAFSQVASLVKRDSPKVSAQCVRLEVSSPADGLDSSSPGHAASVTLESTDMSNWLVRSVPNVSVTEGGGGVVILPTDRVRQIFSSVSADLVLIFTEGDHIHIVAGDSKFRLMSLNPDEFPRMPESFPDAFWQIDASVFRTMIDRTVFAADVSTTRYVFGGCCFRFGFDDSGYFLTIVATDGRRLPMVTCPIDLIAESDEAGTALYDPLADEFPVAPEKFLRAVSSRLAKTEGAIELFVNPKNHIMIRTRDMTMYGRLLEGRFPPGYSKAIPTGEADALVCPAGILRSAVIQASIVTSEISHAVEFTAATEPIVGGRLSLRSASADVGDADITIPVDYSGPEKVFNLDPRYLIDMLSSLGNPDESVRVEVFEDSQSVLFRVGETYIYMVATLGPAEKSTSPVRPGEDASESGSDPDAVYDPASEATPTPTKRGRKAKAGRTG